MSEEQRADARDHVTFDAGVDHTGESRAVEVTNLSRRGCRFHLPASTIAAGTPVSIRADRVGDFGAHVKWRRGEWHGVVFDQPLHDAVLDHMRLFLSSEPALHTEEELTVTG